MFHRVRYRTLHAQRACLFCTVCLNGRDIIAPATTVGASATTLRDIVGVKHCAVPDSLVPRCTVRMRKLLRSNEGSILIKKCRKKTIEIRRRAGSIYCENDRQYLGNLGHQKFFQYFSKKDTTDKAHTQRRCVV